MGVYSASEQGVRIELTSFNQKFVFKDNHETASKLPVLDLGDHFVLYSFYSTFILASDVFKLLSSKYKKADLTVGASFFEIYSGKVRQSLPK